MTLRGWIVAAGATLLAGCNPVANLNAGDSEIEKFHAAYSRGNHQALYAMTGPQIRSGTSEAQFDAMLDVFDVRLGPVKSSERTSFNVNTTPAGTFTTIVMSTQFVKGDGQETFVFSGNGDEMTLEGWHVNSPNLMLTPEDIADERRESTGPALPARPVRPNGPN
jgi:hypothetical protein